MARWSRSPRRIKTAVRRRIKSVRDDFAVEMADQIISNTPVREGWARGSWFVGDGFSPKRKAPTGRASFVAAASTIKKTPIDTPIRFRSTLSYIIKLEYGSSPQSEAFMRGAIANANNTLVSVVNMSVRI